MDDLVIGPILADLLAEPGNEAAAAVEDERAVLGADTGSGQPFGEVVGKTAILEDVIDPPGEAFFGRQPLELTDFLQRRHRAHQTQSESASDGQIVCWRGGLDLLLVPLLAKGGIDLGDRRRGNLRPGRRWRRIAWRASSRAAA